MTCRKKNLKLNPSKFKIGPEVEFGGSKLKFSKANKRVQITPSQKKIEELMGKEPPKTKKQLQSILGSLNQLSTWMPGIKTHIPLMLKLSDSELKKIEGSLQSLSLKQKRAKSL